MKIIQLLLPINGFSRTGRKRSGGTKIIALHNVGVPGQRAQDVIAYFASLATQDAMDNKPDISASAHYVIDLDGVIYQCIPNDERAYHVGSTQKDPISGFIYTEKARILCGAYAANPTTMSPNNCSIGIELCHGAAGFFTAETINAALSLTVSLCKAYGLTENEVVTHKEIVGWKECPLLWTKKPSLFTAFKADVKRLLCL